MSLIRTQIYIGGMTCINCQNTIERTISALSGVQEITVSYKEGTAHIAYDPDRISPRQLEQKIEELDYKVLQRDQCRDVDISRTVSFLAIIIALFVLLQRFGILNLLVPSQLADSSMGYGMLFVVGLLTSVHCVAMCGGINLSQCLPGNASEAGGQTGASIFPSFLYNLGRVASYTAVGFLLGAVGMLIGSAGARVPVLVQGILKLMAGVVMVVMGLNMLGIFPWLRRLNPGMPRFIAKKINRKKAVEHRPLIVGLLNGLMPCGPLQSMQILALASGNPLVGAFSMLLFALGTVPLMLGLGTLVFALGRKFAGAVMSVGAVLVAVLGLAMISQGTSLSGMFFPDITWRQSGSDIAASQGSTVQIVDGVQLVDSTLAPGQYPTIMVQAKMPVRWTIHAPDGSINGCNYRMIIGAYGIEYSFEEGENVIEFTPTDAGNVSYTCWMGMIQGNIIVTENGDA